MVVVVEVGDGSANVGRLSSFVASAEEQDDAFAGEGVVDAVTGAVVDPQLPNTLADGLVITEVASGDAVDAGDDSGNSDGVGELVQPDIEWIGAVGSEVVPDFVYADGV